jgi:hypothetical protein
MRGFAEAAATARGFLALCGGGENAFDADIGELVRPNLAVLAHKRTRLGASPDEPMGSTPRWMTELDFYVDRILMPMLCGKTVARAHVVERVDRLIAAEQARAGMVGETPPPITWRVETGWAN